MPVEFGNSDLADGFVELEVSHGFEIKIQLEVRDDSWELEHFKLPVAT